MDLSKLPKRKGQENKVKKTFQISEDDDNVYTKAKEVGIDSTQHVTNAIKKAIEEIRKALEKVV